MHLKYIQIKCFRNSLFKWYIKSGRHFSWRNPSASNYLLIISEVLLQRTKAETVQSYLPRFLNRFPSWKKLSLAKEIELVKILKPIGLQKQRGKRLYRLAQEMKRLKSRFPTNREEVENLPMMGQYIANAYELYILSNRVPLLDVNMARLLERYFGDRQLADIRYDPYLQTLARQVVNTTKAKEINWAILDFAALVCKSRNPLCSTCVLNKNCLYFKRLKP